MDTPVTSGHTWSHLVNSDSPGHSWSHLVTFYSPGHIWSHLVTSDITGHTWSLLTPLVTPGHIWLTAFLLTPHHHHPSSLLAHVDLTASPTVKINWGANSGSNLGRIFVN